MGASVRFQLVDAVHRCLILLPFSRLAFGCLRGVVKVYGQKTALHAQLTYQVQRQSDAHIKQMQSRINKLTDATQRNNYWRATLKFIADDLGLPLDKLRIESKVAGRPAVFYDSNGSTLCACAVGSKIWMSAHDAAVAIHKAQLKTNPPG